MRARLARRHAGKKGVRGRFEEKVFRRHKKAQRGVENVVLRLERLPLEDRSPQRRGFRRLEKFHSKNGRGIFQGDPRRAQGARP